MNEKANFSPLIEMLSIEGISACEVANLFDELAYDYAQTIIMLQQANLTPSNVLHEETHKFLYLLREFRDVFRKCNF